MARHRLLVAAPLESVYTALKSSDFIYAERSEDEDHAIVQLSDGVGLIRSTATGTEVVIFDEDGGVHIQRAVDRLRELGHQVEHHPPA